MKYTIKWIERKPTSTGKIKADATLTDQSGVESDKVTVWGDFPGFAELVSGGTVSGDIVSKQNGQYFNRTLYPERTDTMSNPKAPLWATKGGGGIAKAQEKKAEGIREAQENRAEGVKIASTFRDATLITAQLLANKSIGTDEEIIKTWNHWRGWFLRNWDVEEPPF